MGAEILVLATHSAGKRAEFVRLLNGLAVDVRLISDFDLPVPIEDGTSFEENAQIKALAAARATGHPALSEDSGLVINALNGQPGIHTADWFTNDTGQRDQTLGNQRILDALTASKSANRAALFVSVIVHAWPDGRTQIFRAETPGTIAPTPRGPHGFGFDPLFIPDGAIHTFGEMQDEDRLIHSARRKVCELWREQMVLV